MARAKVAARQYYGHRKNEFGVRQTPGDQNKFPPRIGKKNILNRRIRNRSIEIKKLLDNAN